MAWVFESNPGIAYEVGSPGRYQSADTWSGGMPDPFGTATQADYLYSIYASYTPGGGPTQYTLTTNTVGNGSITLNPPGGTYNEGTVVTLTAVPDAGWQFDSWSGDLSGSTNPTTITMDANKSVTATFSQIPVNQHTLTVNTVGQGSVTLNPPGGVYDEGTVVTPLYFLLTPPQPTAVPCPLPCRRTAISTVLPCTIPAACPIPLAAAHKQIISTRFMPLTANKNWLIHFSTGCPVF